MKELDEFLELARKHETRFRETQFAFPEGYDNLKAGYYTVGQSEEVFCFLGCPDGKAPRGGYPAVVLLHGGSGYAFFEWVKVWTDRGYAAIAMDLSGHYATDAQTRLLENPKGGPSGYGSIEDYASDCPWLYFCVASASAAVDVLTADSRIDPDRIVMQGISWGGFVALTAAAKEKRVKALSVIYSSGFISDSKWGMEQGLKALDGEQLAYYNSHVDPQTYASEIDIPVFFSAGTDDGAFTVKNRCRTAKRIRTEKVYSYRKNFPHGHIEGWSEGETKEFFDRVLKGEKLPKITADKGKMTAENAILRDLRIVYTTEDPETKDICEWEEAEFSESFEAPEGAKAYFVCGVTDEGLLLSSEIYVR